MIVAVTHFEIKPDKMNELNNEWDTLVKEALKEKGLKKALLLVSPERKCMAIGFWDNFENARKWGATQTYHEFLNSLKDLVVERPERHVYTIGRGDLSEFLEAKKAA